MISGLERVGLARNVVRIAPERQAARLAGSGDGGAHRQATKAANGNGAAPADDGAAAAAPERVG